MSASKKQLIANRANAQKSTGPKTNPGKAITSQNAVKHGFYSRHIIINSPYFKEDPDEYLFLFQSLCDELKPQTLFQEYLVRKITNCLWRSQRAVIAETAHICRHLDGVDDALYFTTRRDPRFKKNNDYDYDVDEDIDEEYDENSSDDTANEKEFEEYAEENALNDSVDCNDSVSALSEQIRSNIIGMRVLPDSDDCMKILHFEMRLDRQMARIYKLLKQLQKNSSIPPSGNNEGNP